MSVTSPFLTQTDIIASPHARTAPTPAKRKGSFWQPALDVESIATYFKLPQRERQRSKSKLVLARLCFFFAAMTLYTFSDAMDSIAITILTEYNASAADVTKYGFMEAYLLGGMCLGCVISGVLYDIVKPAVVPLVGVIIVVIGAALNAMNVLWLNIPNIWWLQVIRSFAGFGIGCLYVASAMLTANCGLHRALPKELAITCFAYGAGAVASMVVRIVFQQVICSHELSVDCSLHDMEMLWVTASTVLFLPAIAVIFFVTKVWTGSNIRKQYKIEHAQAVALHTNRHQRNSVSSQRSSAHSSVTLPPPVPPVLACPEWPTIRAGIGAGLTWFMVDAFFYGGSMYDSASRSSIDLDPIQKNGSAPESAFAKFSQSNLEQALIALLSLIGFWIAIPLLGRVNRWYLQAIAFGALTVTFVSLAVVYLVIASPLENCTTIRSASSVGFDHASNVWSESSINSSRPALTIAPAGHSDEQADVVDAFAFCLIIIALVLLNMGPNVTALVIAVDTAPSRLYQGAYFGCVACVGKLGAVVGWFIIRAIDNGVSPSGLRGDDSSDLHGDCGYGWSNVACALACVVASVVALLTRRTPRSHVTAMISSKLSPQNLNYSAIHDNIIRHREASAHRRFREAMDAHNNPDRSQHNHGLLAGGGGSRYGTIMSQDANGTLPNFDNAREFMIPFHRIVVGTRFAAGGCGQLYHGELDGEPVALKELFATLLTGSTVDVLYEANMLMRLQHPNMVRFFGITDGNASDEDVAALDASFQSQEEAMSVSQESQATIDSDMPPPPLFIVTEFCSGGNIKQLVQKRSGELLLTHMLKYCSDLTNVMQFLHQRPKAIVHLDIKPENLLLEFSHPSFLDASRETLSKGIDGLPKLKLCDLGVSKIQNGSHGGGVLNSQVGTILYMPPEMLQQNDVQINGKKVDVYSAALTFYYMLTCQIPFSVRNLNDAQIVAGLLESQIRPIIPQNFPPLLSELLNKMWPQEPRRRISFRSASRLLSSILEQELQRSGRPRVCGWAAPVGLLEVGARGHGSPRPRSRRRTPVKTPKRKQTSKVRQPSSPGRETNATNVPRRLAYNRSGFSRGDEESPAKAPAPALPPTSARVERARTSLDSISS